MPILLSNFYINSINKEHPAFADSLEWGSDSCLKAVLDLIDLEINAGVGDVDSLSPHLAPLFLDFESASDNVQQDVEYLRLYLSTRMSLACVIAGRWSRAYEWLLCGVTDQSWTAMSSGETVVSTPCPDRIQQIFNNERLAALGDARRTVLTWISTLFDYSWKQGALREFANAVLQRSINLLILEVEKLTGVEQDAALEALCHLCTWLQGNGKNEIARVIVSLLERMSLEETVSAHGQIKICILLSGPIGFYSTRTRNEWAAVGLKNKNIMTGLDRMELLLNRSYQSDAVIDFDDIQKEARDYAEQNLTFAQNPTSFNYIQAGVYCIVRLFVARLITEGRPDLAIELLAAWYGVPNELARKSSVIACVATFPDAIVYTEKERVHKYDWESTDEMKKIMGLQNRALGTSNSIADDHTFRITTPERPGIPDNQLAGEFADNLAKFYKLDQLRISHETNPITASALLRVESFPHPIQAILLDHIGMTWPLVTSYEEPADDRKLRKVFLWSVGTLSGQTELNVVSEILSSNGIESDCREGDLKVTDFVKIYEDPQYDAIWINAHGEFSGPDPHNAHILLSQDGMEQLAISQLAKNNIPNIGRRLLFLNICDGGNIMMTDAPPRLGFAPMLATRHQAVISQLWPVEPFVASAFAAFLADGLAGGSGYFSAYRDALSIMRSDIPMLLELLNCIEPLPISLIDRLRNKEDDYLTQNIFHWGSPVFYE